MPGLGRTVIGNTGQQVRVSADGKRLLKTGGITIDWSLIAAVAGSDLVTPVEGITVKVGFKWFRFGQVMCKVTTAEVITLTLTGGPPTAGSFLMTVTRPDTGFSQVLTVPYNVTVAGLQALLDPVLGTGNSLVAGTAFPTGPLTVTIQGVLVGTLVPAFTIGALSLTGGGTPAAAITAGANSGNFGPYDFAATDGRQTCSSGNCYIMDETVLQSGVLGIFSALNTTNVGNAMYGGRVWYDRVIATTGTHSLANGPTWTELLAALPQIQQVRN
jgi:hypothetical protein